MGIYLSKLITKPNATAIAAVVFLRMIEKIQSMIPQRTDQYGNGINHPRPISALEVVDKINEIIDHLNGKLVNLNESNEKVTITHG